jgi:phage-related protein
MATMKQIQAVFFRTAAGSEPVREWLRNLAVDDRKAIGDDIRRVEFRWPVGMPLSRPLGRGLHEVRSQLPSGRIARVIFYVSALQRMILLHAFFKTTQQTPKEDLDLARRRKQEHERSA